MTVRSTLSTLGSRDASVYLALSILSLLKAAGLRHNSRRFRKELLDAGVFFGLAVLHRVADGPGESTPSANSKRARRSGRNRASPGESSADSVRAATDAIRGKLSRADAKPESRLDTVKRRFSRA